MSVHISEWSRDAAERKVDELLERMGELREFVQGSDSDLVYTKLGTVESGLRLLREYLAEAEGGL